MADADRHLDNKQTKLGKDTLGELVKDNVLYPIYDTLVVEPGNALRQTINYAARPFIQEDLIVPRLEFSRRDETHFLGGEWWTQNICSGLAAAAVYTIAGKLTGGFLRGAHSKVHKLGMEMLTSDLGLKCRPVTDVLGTTGNLASRVILNEKVAQVIGAACYDGLKETKLGETNLGNMAGGAASFTVFEAGNALIGNKFITAMSPGLLGKAKIELTKAGLRLIPGALGSSAQVVTSHMVSGNELPADAKTWTESLVTGGAMNAVLPWFQYGIGKGIDTASTALDKSIPYQRYNQERRSPIVDELSNRNPEARVKIDNLGAKTFGQNYLMHLVRGASESEQAHELTHIDMKKQFARATEIAETKRLLRSGDTAEARRKYLATRTKEEIFSRVIEEAVHIQSQSFKMKDLDWTKIGEEHPLWNRIALDPSYRRQFDSDFEKLSTSQGKFIVETDYSSKTLRDLVEKNDVDGVVKYLFPTLSGSETQLIKEMVAQWGEIHPDASPANILIGLKQKDFAKTLSAVKVSDTGVYDNWSEFAFDTLLRYGDSLDLHGSRNKLKRASEVADLVQSEVEAELAKRNERFRPSRAIYDRLLELNLDPHIPLEILNDSDIHADDVSQKVFDKIVRPAFDEYKEKIGKYSIFDLLEDSSLFVGDQGEFARKCLPMQSILSLTTVFGSKVDAWIDRQRTMGRSFHDYTYWLPNNSAHELKGLADFLLNNSSRRVGELGLIARRWSRLSAEEREYDINKQLELVKEMTYKNAKVPDLVAEAIKFGVEGRDYALLERRFSDSQLVASPFPQGKTWESGSLKGYFLSRSDARGLFLGEYTDCCQHVGHYLGHRCAWYGQEKPNSGFFVVENGKGEIVAQSWAWVSDNGGLCFDNIEGTKDCRYKHGKTVANLYQMVADELSNQFHTVTVGVSGTDISLDAWKNAENSALQVPSDYPLGYTDSREQVILAGGTETQKTK